MFLSADKIQSLEDQFQTGRLSCGVKESVARTTHLNVDVEVLIFVDFLFCSLSSVQITILIIPV